MFFVLLVGCSSPQAPVGSSESVCSDEAYPEFKTTCLVGHAQAASRAGDDAEAEATCGLVPDGRWRDECWFMLGEDRMRRGVVDAGLDACGKSLGFVRHCLRHAVWTIPPGDEGPNATRWRESAHQRLEPLSAKEADGMLMARWWFNRYLGTGSADPAAALAAPKAEAAVARMGWALEWVRLAGVDAPVERGIDVWMGRAPPPTGPPLPLPARIGNHNGRFPTNGEAHFVHSAMWSDGERLVAFDVVEDLTICILEARFFVGMNDGSSLVPYLSSPSPVIRYAAMGLYGQVRSPSIVDQLLAYAKDSDPVIRDQVTTALKERRWEAQAINAGLLGGLGAPPTPGTAGPPTRMGPANPPPYR